MSLKPTLIGGNFASSNEEAIKIKNGMGKQNATSRKRKKIVRTVEDIFLLDTDSDESLSFDPTFEHEEEFPYRTEPVKEMGKAYSSFDKFKIFKPKNPFTLLENLKSGSERTAPLDDPLNSKVTSHLKISSQKEGYRIQALDHQQFFRNPMVYEKGSNLAVRNHLGEWSPCTILDIKGKQLYLHFENSIEQEDKRMSMCSLNLRAPIPLLKSTNNVNKPSEKIKKKPAQENLKDPVLSFFFQSGLHRGSITVNSETMTLTSLYSLAITFIKEKYPEQSDQELNGCIELFIHNYAHENLLLPLRSVTSIKNDIIVEIVMKASYMSCRGQQKQRSLSPVQRQRSLSPESITCVPDIDGFSIETSSYKGGKHSQDNDDDYEPSSDSSDSSLASSKTRSASSKKEAGASTSSDRPFSQFAKSKNSFTVKGLSTPKPTKPPVPLRPQIVFLGTPTIPKTTAPLLSPTNQASLLSSPDSSSVNQPTNGLSNAKITECTSLNTGVTSPQASTLCKEAVPIHNNKSLTSENPPSSGMSILHEDSHIPVSQKQPSSLNEIPTNSKQNNDEINEILSDSHSPLHHESETPPSRGPSQTLKFPSGQTACENDKSLKCKRFSHSPVTLPSKALTPSKPEVSTPTLPLSRQEKALAELSEEDKEIVQKIIEDLTTGNSTYHCPDCNATFKQKTLYEKHLKQKHPERWKMFLSIRVKRFLCEECGRTYHLKNHLIYHIKNFHEDKGHSKFPRKTLKKKCVECNEGFRTYEEVNNHLMQEHGIPIEEHQLTFGSFEDFIRWKEEQETQSDVKFRRTPGYVNQSLDCFCLKYVCNFAANCNPIYNWYLDYSAMDGINCCPAVMRVRYFSSDKVEVFYIPTHLGHEKMLQESGRDKQKKKKKGCKENQR